MAIVKGKGRKRPKPEKKLVQGRAVPSVPSSQVALVSDEKNPKSEKRKRSAVDVPGGVINSRIMDRAKEIQSSLPQEFPSLVKVMLTSHVTRCFWLGIPKEFCTRHLPKEETIMTLEYENGEEHEAKYLPHKTGLSGGWRGFSTAHSLLEGDVLVFQLVEPTKFKVYIVRSNSYDKVGGVLELRELDPCPKRICSEDCVNGTSQEENGQNSDDIVSELLDGITFSEEPLDFKDVRGMEDFRIVVDDLVIDSELSNHVKEKYYDLCLSQRSLLHEKLIGGLNCKLAAGIISETVNLADAIRAAKITTPIENLVIWDKTLNSFSDLGMKVGFLRARLDRLISLVDRSKRIETVRSERARAEKESRRLEERIAEVRDVIGKFDGEIEMLHKDEDWDEAVFRELANAPW